MDNRCVRRIMEETTVKTFLLSLLIFMVSMGTGFAQLEVNQGELNKGTDVEFINYSGPYDRYWTFDEIREIGVNLAKNFTAKSYRYTYNGVFTIIHVYDPEDTSEKFNADIFVIEPGAFVDHVRTLRIVLAGYLQTAYGYTLDDALLIARFVTLYNAVFRGDTDYFNGSYKTKVTANLSASDAGLAISYSEWPGRTKMLIPLSDKIGKGDTTSIDTQKITEQEVKDALKTEEDKGIEDRKQMVELQEKQIEDKEKALEEDKKQLEEDKKQLEEDKKSGLDTTEQEKEIAKKEEEIKKAEEDLKKAEEQLKNDREEITRDERSLQDNQTTTSTTATVDSLSSEKGFLLHVTPGSEDEDGQLYLYNFQSDAVEAKTSGIQIKARRLYIYNNTLLVVAEPTGKGASYLMFLDAKTLAVTNQSQEEVYPLGVVTTQGNALFAIISRGDQSYVGKFNTSLTLTYHSQEEVNPSSPLVVSGTYIYAQSKDGKILRLGVNDLTTKESVEPK